eukprot:959445-Lingulodinium_polyedra.AAC.1
MQNAQSYPKRVLLSRAPSTKTRMPMMSLFGGKGSPLWRRSRSVSTAIGVRFGPRGAQRSGV